MTKVAQQQRDAIGEAIREVMEAPAGSTLCCTIEAVNAEGQDVAIQVMQNSLSISPYAFEDDPVNRLEISGAMGELGEDTELELIDWDPGSHAVVGFSGLDMGDVALLVDQAFVKILACDDADYAPVGSTEDLGG